MTDPPLIALIDDDRAWAESLAEYLNGKGFTVRHAEDGERGLALLQANGFAAAVVDLHLPGLDGLRLLRLLRQGRHRVPFVLVSSDAEPALAERVLAEGGQAFVPKTASPSVLLQTLRRAVRQAGAEDD